MGSSYTKYGGFSSKRLVTLIGAGLLTIESVALITLRGNATYATACWQISRGTNEALWVLLLITRMRVSVHLKAHWALFAAAWSLNATGDFFDAFSQYALHEATSLYVSSGRELFRLTCVVPLFMLTALPSGRRYLRAFVWMDVVQAIFATLPAYFLVFNTMPFAPRTGVGASTSFMVHVFEIVQIWATLGLVAHLIASKDRDERQFYRFAAIFFGLGGAAMVLNNEVSLVSDEIWTNVLVYAVDMPILLVFLHLLPLERRTSQPERSSALFADLINLGSPVAAAGGLFALGVALLPNAIGVATIIIAFVIFAGRSTVYLRCFEQAQLGLENAKAQLEMLSYTDELTGVANRRSFDQALELEWRRGWRTASDISLILIDVDYFKQLNDSAGHQAGDACLTSIAAALRSALSRSTDFLARYGGDEFVVILPNTDAVSAQFVAGRLRDAVGALRIRNPATGTGYATISLGISTCIGFAGRSAHEMLTAADEALYEAKRAGRNGWRSMSLPGSPRLLNAVAC